MPYYPTLPSAGDTTWAGPLNTAILGVNSYVASVESTANSASSQAGSALSAAQSAASSASSALSTANTKYLKPGSGIPLSDLAQSVQDAISAATGGGYVKPSTGIPLADLSSTVQSALALANSSYQLPSGGITTASLASGVVTTLGKADSAYQKPGSGIPLSDLAQAVRDAISAGGGGGYVKPANGIPLTDLTSGIQTSLGKADSAIQAVSSATISDATTTGRAAIVATNAAALATAAGLGNVTNTSDANKPVSTAQATAIGAKYTKPGTGIPLSDLAQSVQDSINSATGGGYVKPTNGIPASDLASAVQSNLTLASTAYQKPANGITTSDLASAIGTSLGKADSAYQKPANGITTADLVASVVTSLGKADSAIQVAVTSFAGRTGAVTATVADLTDITTVGSAVAKATSAPIAAAAIGLGNVTNTADADKPVSSAQATAIAAKYTKPGTGIPLTDLAQAIQDKLNAAVVSSVAGRTGAVVVTASDVGLGNVNNTSDLGKPISTATQAALDTKYVKPGSGIPLSDLAAGVQTLLAQNFQRVVRSTTASITSSTTSTADSVLTLPVVSGATYAGRVTIFYEADQAGDLKIGLTAPSGSVMDGYYDGTTVGGTSSTMADQARGTKSFHTIAGGFGAVGGLGAGIEAWATIDFTVTAGADGAVTLIWAQNVSSTVATILHARSDIQLTRIG